MECDIAPCDTAALVEAKSIMRRVENVSDLRLINRLEVIQWLLGDTSFLKIKKRKGELLILEREWGVQLLRLIRPDSTTTSNWGGDVGEEITRELLLLGGEVAVKPPLILEKFKLDWETPAHLIESKSQGHHMTGTANEKNAGVAFKYATVPKQFKPVRIVLLGGAETHAVKDEILEPRDPDKKAFVEFWKTMGFTFVGGSQILRAL